MTSAADSWKHEQEKYKATHFRIAYLAELVAQQVARVPEPVIVDIGGGPGALRELLAATGARVLVIDIHSDLTSDVFLHDMRTPWPGEPTGWPRADVVILSGVLEYLEDWTHVIRAVRALLKPGGACIATYVNFERARRRRHHPWWVGQRPIHRAISVFEDGELRIDRTVALWQITAPTAKHILGRDHYTFALRSRLSMSLARTLCDQFVLHMRFP